MHHRITIKKFQNLITSTERTYIQGFSLTSCLYCMVPLAKNLVDAIKSPVPFCLLHMPRLLSVSTMIKNLNWESLEAHRTKSSLIMFYKMFNNLAAIPYEYHIKSIPNSTTRYSHQHKILPLSSSKMLPSFLSFFP